ncbi:unnamed protein product [Prorocentrum cordatum]|uniref:DNA-directed DNA polymerase family A palm domain-containing protein n=1 Tax=Prorocentrum cordatum TaxID=2364126 RepID=A0ABN9SP30_9DINO|nr:unnamed protein product [Polarella glacialis]
MYSHPLSVVPTKTMGVRYSARAICRLGVQERWQRIVAKRQATNSPIQGGSADIVVEAMLKAHGCEELRRLEFAVVMQVHDELVFEGPAENATAALAVVKDIMERPFLDGLELKVPLVVDAKVAKTWAGGT